MLEAMRVRPWLDVARADEAVVLDGTIDRRSAEYVRPMLVDAIDRADEGNDVVVDIADVTYVDTCGLGMLLAAHRRAARKGCRLVLRSPSPGLVRAVAVTKLSRVLNLTR